MADMRARMAALRAKRAARNTKAAEESQPKCTAAVLAAAQAAGAPQTTWDEDYRERLAGTVDSSDDDEDAIVVLPPPTVKLDPIAKRVAWRKKQRAAAAAQAAELVRDEYPAPAPLISQPQTFDSAPKEDVDNEEQLLEEIVVDDEGSSSDEEGDEEDVEEEQQQDGVDEVPDKEEGPPNELKESETDGDISKENNQSTQESDDMETQTPHVNESENSDKLIEGTQPDSNDAETQPAEEHTSDSLEAETQAPIAFQSAEDLNEETQAPKDVPGKCTVSQEEAQPDISRADSAVFTSPTPIAERNKGAFKTMGDTSNFIADSQQTAESSRATLPLAVESSSTAKSTAWEALTCGSSDYNNNSSSKSKVNNNNSIANNTPKETAVTVSSGALLGKFTKLGAMASAAESPSTPPRKKFSKFTKLSMLPVTARNNNTAPKAPCPFIEDEAEDEVDGDGMTQNIDTDDEDEVDALIDDRVVADTQHEEGDAARLADFHRQWQTEADEGAVKEAAKAVGRNIDNDMDLAELIQKQKERDAQNKANGEDGNNDDAASVCGGGNNNNRNGEEQAAVDDYVENMFRDETSRLMNELQDDVDDDEFEAATPEERRREARALWKARRKHMAERRARDPHAISLLNIFEEEADDDEIEANISRLKAQLVSSNTPARKDGGYSDDEDDNEYGGERNNNNKNRKKRKAGDDNKNNNNNAPEWQRRRRAMAHMEKRRRTASCLDGWAHDTKVSAVEHTVGALRSPANNNSAPRMKRVRAPPVGGSFGKPMLNAMPVKMKKKRNNKMGQAGVEKKKRAGTRKLLMAALGERPRSEM